LGHSRDFNAPKREVRFQPCPDAVERWIATRGRTNFEDQKAISFEGVALDISARKQAERILEHRVQNRTREPAQVN
jgi:signal transduction histidine kinase